MMKQQSVAKAFVKSYVPAHFLAKVELSSMRYVDKTFINQKNQRREADIIYQFRFAGGEEQGFFYTLIEHQHSQLCRIIFEYMYWEYPKVNFVMMSQRYLSGNLRGEAMSFAESLLQEGRQEGRIEGRVQEQQANHKKMLVLAGMLFKEGLKVNKIAKLTGLKASEVELLIQN